MLLIIFYGEFCSFHMLVMPRLESQLNHGEFKLKSGIIYGTSYCFLPFGYMIYVCLCVACKVFLINNI